MGWVDKPLKYILHMYGIVDEKSCCLSFKWRQLFYDNYSTRPIALLVYYARGWDGMISEILEEESTQKGYHFKVGCM